MTAGRDHLCPPIFFSTKRLCGDGQLLWLTVGCTIFGSYATTSNGSGGAVYIGRRRSAYLNCLNEATDGLTLCYEDGCGGACSAVSAIDPIAMGRPCPNDRVG